MSKKQTQGEVIQAFIGHHGDKYDYSKVVYVNSKVKVEVVCPEHGSFSISPNHHKRGTGCRKCYFESNKISKKDFIIRSRQHFGNRYDYSFNSLSSVGEDVEIKCVEHGITFSQEPRNHMKGHTGCPECLSNKLTGPAELIGQFTDQETLNREFIEKATKVHGGRYDYSKFIYTASSKTGIIICSRHGEFKQTPSNHLKDSNCPDCAEEDKYLDSFKQQCKDKGVDYWVALKRRDAGMPVEKIFSKESVRGLIETTPVTVYGVSYPNLMEAYRNLNPVPSTRTIARRLKAGMMPGEAFEKIPNPGYANGIIYLVTNKVNGMLYVGLTVQTLEARWKSHIEHAQAGHIKDNESLHAAIREFGEDSFEIKQIDQGTTKKDLEAKEKAWIKKLNTVVPGGYNISAGGTSGGSNKQPTEVDGKTFPSAKAAAEYISETRGISFQAAKKRLSVGRVDVRTPAKPGESIVKTKTYKAWDRIVHQAVNPDSKDYLPGITIYEPWLDSLTFYEEVGLPPEQNMSFIRIDKSKGFHPENCKWVTKSEASKINAAYMKQKGTLTGKTKRVNAHLR